MAHAQSHTKRIWNVFWILSAITIVEVILGIIKPGPLMGAPLGTSWLNIIFILLTLVKAYYIVSVFMHLGGEKKGFQYAIYLPALILIPYLTFILLVEGGYTFAEAPGIY